MEMSAHVDWPIWQLAEALGVRLSLDFFGVMHLCKQ